MMGMVSDQLPARPWGDPKIPQLRKWGAGSPPRVLLGLILHPPIPSSRQWSGRDPN